MNSVNILLYILCSKSTKQAVYVKNFISESAVSHLMSTQAMTKVTVRYDQFVGRYGIEKKNERGIGRVKPSLRSSCSRSSGAT